MFYSQFILAKKGPLGTIWIAAHLERKLRKNQVADTDIGVSVDSILFPDVPIALRLSSHLLLGVVRIYSRKVNYLFDDCSEALLKIKQAFRSTAVDLPPEESTAPYHSITLPETFYLDDFELPDNDIFQGNYVDHHISAREQITLQDTIEGVVYSTSQFGLDERFGDGDASQVGLDLEEDLFLDKVSAPEIGAVERTDHLMSDGSFPKGEASQEGGSSEAIPMNGTTAKFKDGIANSEFTDEAQAPSTPGLIEEPNLSTVQEGLAYYDNVDSEDHNLTEPGELDIQQNASNNEEIYNKNGVNLSLGDPLNHDNMVYMPPGDNSCLSGDEKVNQAGIKDLSTIVKTDNVGADKFDGRNKVELSNNDDECINKLSMPSLDQMNGLCEQNIVEASLHKTAENGDEDEKSDAEGENASNVASSLKLPCHLEHNNSEALDIQRLEDSGTLDVPTDNEKTVSTLPAEAVPCSVVTFTMEEELHDCGTSAKVQGDGSHMTDCILTGENLADVEKRDEHLVSQVDDVDNSQVIDVPAFEKLLAAPEILPDKPDDLVVESTPDKEVLDSVDGSVDGTKISGRKRSFTESTLTMETLNSAESFGAPRSKRTAEFIPDDDDLLSSILVGRKSSTLKMKPTPPAPEATSMKRSRSATKPSSMKRKLQMDDSMVLLGDVIREQLTNTEDIRRLRKKAPCTRAEILMIQRQFLEEEIFSELLLAGISSELAYVHGGTHDLSGIIISEVDDDSGFMKFMNHEGYSTQPMANQDGKIEHHGEPSGIVGQPADRASETENHHSVNHGLGINHDSVDANAAEIVGNGSSEYHASSEMCETRCDVGNAGIPGNSNHAVILEHDVSQPAFVSGDMNEIPSSSVVPLDVRDDPTSAEICLNVHNESVENVSFPRDMANGEVPDGIKILEHCSAIVPESMFEELPMIEIKDAAQAEIREDKDTSDFASAKEDGASLVDLASEMAGCTSSVNQAVDNIEYRDLAVTNADGSVTVDLGFIEKDEITKDFGNEESKIASTHLGIEVEAKDGFIDDPSQSLCQEVDQQSTMIIENTSLDHFTDGNFRDFEDTAMIHDTEFLNMEDDDDGEDECGVMNAEEARLLDNSGWSSRTRAVASYLQNLFEKEDGRRIQCVDNLLVGKTRKEASRMFFETLVLKTRDYIEVEQRKAFDDINIKARPKLMKSEF